MTTPYASSDFLLEAAHAERSSAGRCDFAEQLLAEPCLADAGLADEDDEPAVRPDRAIGVRQRLQLAVATDEPIGSLGIDPSCGRGRSGCWRVGTLEQWRGTERSSRRAGGRRARGRARGRSRGTAPAPPSDRRRRRTRGSDGGAQARAADRVRAGGGRTRSPARAGPPPRARRRAGRARRIPHVEARPR